MIRDRRPTLSRPMRWFIIAIIVAVAWVPGFVALSMLLSGNAG